MVGKGRPSGSFPVRKSLDEIIFVPFSADKLARTCLSFSGNHLENVWDIDKVLGGIVLKRKNTNGDTKQFEVCG